MAHAAKLSLPGGIGFIVSIRSAGFGHACAQASATRSRVLNTSAASRHTGNPMAAKTLGIELKFALVARVDRVIQSSGKMSAGTKQTSELWRAAALRHKQTFPEGHD